MGLHARSGLAGHPVWRMEVVVDGTRRMARTEARSRHAFHLQLVYGPVRELRHGIQRGRPKVSGIYRYVAGTLVGRGRRLDDGNGGQGDERYHRNVQEVSE